MARLSREEKRFETQEKIKSAALKAFASNGFSGAAIDRIAEDAGFSRGAFYSNYSTKEELLLDLLQEQHEREISKWQSMIADADNLEITYQKMSEEFIAYLQQAEWGLFNIEVQLHAKRNPDFAKRYNQYVTAVNSNIAESLSAMYQKANRQIPADLLLIAAMIRNLVIGISVDTSNDNSPAALQRCTQQLNWCIDGQIQQALIKS
jgi:AcrR family transcriptional regulator